MKRLLIIFIFVLTVAGKKMEKPSYPLPTFDYSYYTNDLAKTIIKQAASLLKSAVSTKVGSIIDCGHPLGKFDNCDGKCYILGMPDCKYRKTRFFLTNSANRDSVQELGFEDANLLRKTNFNRKCKTVLIIHGWTESADIAWMKRMEEALFWKFRKSCLNVIRIGLETTPDFDLLYLTRNAGLIGRRIGFFIKLLMNVMKANPEKIHLVGFSFGGIAMAYTGEYLVKNGIKIGRMTGLDPGSCVLRPFAGGLKLNPSYAKYVDAIHTNGGVEVGPVLLQMGCLLRHGHVDYYVNGGQVQPGCNLTLSNLFCHHLFAPAYFTSSILSEDCDFKSFPASSYLNYGDFQMGKYFSCDDNDCGLMGFHSKETKASGSQFIDTLKIPPYCGSQYKISITFFSPVSAPLFLYIELRDSHNQTTGSMLFPVRVSLTSTITNIVVGNATLDFASGNMITAKFTGNLQQTKHVIVTNDNGQSKEYCNPSTPGLLSRPRPDIQLEDNCVNKGKKDALKKVAGNSKPNLKHLF